MKRRWSKEDRQRFADGDRLKARTVPAKKKAPPAYDEWRDDDPR